MQSDDDENRRLALLALLQQRSNQQYIHSMNQRDHEIDINSGRYFADSFRARLADAEYLQAYQALAEQEQQIQDAQTLRRWSTESSMRSNNQPVDLTSHIFSSNDGDRDSKIRRLLEEVRVRDTLRILDATVGQPLSSNVARGSEADALSWVRGAANLTTSIDTYSRALALASGQATVNDSGTAAYLSPNHTTSGAQRIVASAFSRNRDAKLNPTLMQQQEQLREGVLVGYNLGGVLSVDENRASPPRNKIANSLRKRKSDLADDCRKPAASKRSNMTNITMFPLPAASSKRKSIDVRQQHAKLSPFRETWDQLGEKHDPDTQKEAFLRQLSRGIR